MWDMFLKIIAFGIFGLGMEVVCTAVYAFFSKQAIFVSILNRKSYLLGYSSVWYIPLYALAWPFLVVTHKYLATLPWLATGMIYAIFCHTVEFVGMGVLRKVFGKSPSEDNYRKSSLNIAGLTDLRLFPWFFVAGFCFQWIFNNLK